MSLKSLYTSLFILLLCLPAFAQPPVIEIGLSGGPNWSKIDNVDRIILSEPYFINGINYRLDNKMVRGYSLAAFANYKFNWTVNQDDGTGFVHFETGFAKYGTELLFNNDSAFSYRMKFDYQYIKMLLMVGFKLRALSFGFGPQFSAPIDPSGHIDYSSGGAGYKPAFGTDKAQEQQLRAVLTGRTDLGLVGAIGCQIHPRFDIEGRYHYGLKNIVAVKANAYNFVQQQNFNNFFEILLKFYLTEREPVDRY